MSDKPWRALPAGHDLDRLIAEGLGWTDLHEEEHWYEEPDVSPYQQIDLYGVKNGFKAHLPDYSTDLNARLPLNEGEQIETLELWNGTGLARVSNPVIPRYGEWEKADTLALARARAWLAYRERQE